VKTNSKVVVLTALAIALIGALIAFLPLVTMAFTMSPV
jgi:hypothetical protein